MMRGTDPLRKFPADWLRASDQRRAFNSPSNLSGTYIASLKETVQPRC